MAAKRGVSAVLPRKSCPSSTRTRSGGTLAQPTKNRNRNDRPARMKSHVKRLILKAQILGFYLAKQLFDRRRNRMDLQSNLIESGKLQNGTRKGWKASIAALGVHGLIIAFVVVMSATAGHKVAAEDKPIRAFITAHAAPPPPPPPPPPPAASSAPKSTPVVKPTIIPKTSFVQPKVIPKDVPKVQPVATTQTAAPTSNDQPSAESGGVVVRRRHGCRGRRD